MSTVTDVARPAVKRTMKEDIRVDAMDRFARVVALLIFALGVLMLVAVFFWTKEMFDSLVLANQTWMKRPANPGTDSGLNEYAAAFGGQLVRVGLLFVLGYVASSIATKGAQLFSAAASTSREPSAPKRIIDLP